MVGETEIEDEVFVDLPEIRETEPWAGLGGFRGFAFVKLGIWVFSFEVGNMCL